MQLDLSQIRSGREHIERTYQPSAFGAAAGDDFRVTTPVVLSFDIDKDKAQFRLRGRLRTVLELTCSRCLEPFSWPVDADFDLLYLPQAENTGEGELEIEADDLATAYYRHDAIDLAQLLAEQFQLALPMKPLCSNACRGLCPECGTNLNRDTCDCEPTWQDPRLAELRALLPDRPKR